MKRIQSKFHRIGPYDIFKVSLSCFDDKKYILDDGINSLAYFHKDTVKKKMRRVYIRRKGQKKSQN